MSTPGGTPLDPNKIDIGLEIVGKDSIKQIEGLIAGLAGVQQELGKLGSLIPENQVAGSSALSSRMGQSGIVEGGRSPNASVAANVIPSAQDAHGQGGSNAEELRVLGEAGILRRLKDFKNLPPEERGPVRDWGTNFLDRQIAAYQAREGAQTSRRGGQDVSNISLRGGPDYMNMDAPGSIPGNPTSGQSTGASVPREIAANDPAWLQAMKSNPRRYERGQEPFSIPQFGEWTIQDKLNMASDFFQRRGEQQYARKRQSIAQDMLQSGMDQGYSEEEMRARIQSAEGQAEISQVAQEQGSGLRSGRAAMALRMAADQSASVVAVAREARRAYAYGSGLQQAGVSAGYERAGQINIPGTDIGITNPLNAIGIGLGGSGEAAREAMNQRINIQRLRLKGGIDKQQAAEIVGGLAAAGYTGEEGQNLAFDTISPLVQQGQNAGITVGMMDQAIRNGNTSAKEFLDTMNDLGPAARNARMSLDEYQQALGNFAESAQQLGGTYGQGLALGRNVSTQLGINPQQATAVMQSPLIAANAMAQFGVMPNAIGALGNGNASALGQLTERSIDQVEAMTRPFNRTVRGANGEVVMRGRDAQDAQAAQMMGVPVETYKRLRAGRQDAPGILKAGDALKAYQDATQIIDSQGHQKESRWGIDILKKDKKGTMSETEQNAAEHARDLQWRNVDKALRESAGTLKGKERDQFLKKVGDLEDEKDPSKRAEKAQKLLGERAKPLLADDQRNVTEVRFTGAAAKYFEQVEKKLPDEFKKANQGGTPRNASAAGATGDSDYLDLLRSQYGG